MVGERAFIRKFRTACIFRTSPFRFSRLRKTSGGDTPLYGGSSLVLGAFGRSNFPHRPIAFVADIGVVHYCRWLIGNREFRARQALGIFCKRAVIRSSLSYPHCFPQTDQRPNGDQLQNPSNAVVCPPADACGGNPWSIPVDRNRSDKANRSQDRTPSPGPTMALPHRSAS